MVHRTIHKKTIPVVSPAERERMRQDIHEAFAFLRYLISYPKEITKIKNNSEIHFTHRDLEHKEPSSKRAKINYTTETIFHRV